MKVQELNEEIKQKIVDEINNSPEEEEQSGNTRLFNMASLEELKPFLKDLTPLEMFDKSVAINQTTMANLSDLLPRLSKKNIMRLLFATLKLPEKGASLKFGGGPQEKKLCELAYANSQMARNALVHVLGTTAIAQARLVKQKEQEEAAKVESNEQVQGENNESI
jgi:hypothetical protein